MAAADPLPAKSVPVKDATTRGNNNAKTTKQTKQKPLDTALLCSRLEEHQREQEAGRMRREKRNAVRNGSYVPRSAAQSFAATATPMGDFPSLTRGSGSKRRSAKAHFIAEPLTMDGRICIPAKQRYAALNFGTGNSDDVGVSEEEEASPYRAANAREMRRDLTRPGNRYSYRPAKDSMDPKSVVAPRKASLPLPLEQRPFINERRSSVQALQPQRSKSTSNAPAQVQAPVEEELPLPTQSAYETASATPHIPAPPVPTAPREVSPMRAEELELARGDDRWPSINQDEQDAVEASTKVVEEARASNLERGFSLIQALNMDWDDETEESGPESTFKWDQYDPFKPKTRDSVKSEKHNQSKLQSKRDSMNPVQSDGQTGIKSGTQSTPHRRRSSPRASPQNHNNSQAAEERGRQRYRPGDAAKRRTVDPIGQVQWPVERDLTKRELRPMSFHAITESRLSRFLEQEVSSDAPIPEVDESLIQPQRPKLVPHDRPNWSQESESGDDFRFTLNNFFPRPGRKAAQENRQSILAPFAEPKAPEPKKYTGPQNDHLIADAVKIIQQQEKSRKRESVIGFFKKL